MYFVLLYLKNLKLLVKILNCSFQYLLATVLIMYVGNVRVHCI